MTPTTIPITPYALARRFIGVHELAGQANAPLILAMLQLDDAWPISDEVPWCSAFVNAIAWALDASRTRSLAARSWLHAGQSVTLQEARPGWDIVVLSRGSGGHVGFLHSQDVETVTLLGGNQSNSVSLGTFPKSRVLGVRRLQPVGNLL